MKVYHMACIHTSSCYKHEHLCKVPNCRPYSFVRSNTLQTLYHYAKIAQSISCCIWYRGEVVRKLMMQNSLFYTLSFAHSLWSVSRPQGDRKTIMIALNSHISQLNIRPLYIALHVYRYRVKASRCLVYWCNDSINWDCYAFFICFCIPT